MYFFPILKGKLRWLKAEPDFCSLSLLTEWCALPCSWGLVSVMSKVFIDHHVVMLSPWSHQGQAHKKWCGDHTSTVLRQTHGKAFARVPHCLHKLEMVKTMSITNSRLAFPGEWQRGRQKKRDTNADYKNRKLDERSGSNTPRGW